MKNTRKKVKIFGITAICLLSFLAGLQFHQVQESIRSQISESVLKEGQSIEISPNRTWELVIILEVGNYSHTERVSFPGLNLSEEIVFTIYFLRVNSSFINEIESSQFFEVGTRLCLLFENNELIAFEVV